MSKKEETISQLISQLSEFKLESFKNKIDKIFSQTPEPLTIDKLMKRLSSKIEIDPDSPIETKEYPTTARRPHYSVLNNAKIKETYHLAVPYWKDSIKHCLIALQDKAI